MDGEDEEEDQPNKTKILKMSEKIIYFTWVILSNFYN